MRLLNKLGIFIIIYAYTIKVLKNILEDNAGKKLQKKDKSNNTKNWTPQPPNWLKWTGRHPELTLNSTIISLVYRDNIGRI